MEQDENRKQLTGLIEETENLERLERQIEETRKIIKIAKALQEGGIKDCEDVREGHLYTSPREDKVYSIYLSLIGKKPLEPEEFNKLMKSLFNDYRFMGYLAHIVISAPMTEEQSKIIRLLSSSTPEILYF